MESWAAIQCIDEKEISDKKGRTCCQYRAQSQVASLSILNLNSAYIYPRRQTLENSTIDRLGNVRSDG
jgi:hypothetical protein